MTSPTRRVVAALVATTAFVVGSLALAGGGTSAAAPRAINLIPPTTTVPPTTRNPCPVTGVAVIRCPTTTQTVPVSYVVVSSPSTTVTTTTTPPVIVDNLRVEARGASFGTVPVGATSAPLDIVVSNTGTIPFRLTKASVAPPFLLTGGGSCPSTAALNPGASCTYQVQYRPTAPGTSQTTVAVEVLAPSGPVTVTAGVDGAGAAGRLEFDPAVLELGDGAVGEKATGTATLRNTGSSPVLVTAIAVAKKTPEVVLNVKACFKVTLPAGGSCAVGITVIPKAGDRSFDLGAAGGAGERATMRIHRRALTRSFTLTPGAGDFGVVPVNAKSAPQTFTVTNTGQLPITLAGATIDGAGAPSFGVVSTTCTSAPLAPKATCTILVIAAPTALGAKAASLRVTTTTKGVKAVPLRFRTPPPSTTTAVPTTAAPTTKPPVVTTVVVTTVPVTVAPLHPVLRMDPAVGPTGRVTSAIGTGFPADTEIVLSWAGLAGSWKVRTDAAGAFHVPVLVRTGEPIGGRIMTVVDQAPMFSGVRAPYLVQLATFRPPGNNGRTDRLVARG